MSARNKEAQVHTLLGCHEIVESSHVFGICLGVVMVIFRVNCIGEELEGGLYRVWCDISSTSRRSPSGWIFAIRNQAGHIVTLCAHIEESTLLRG